ncbi:hypothetical protein F7734_15200 [Scytonema sp. UIC 10036]|uniref:hypothetical protein n=1 Tax=Scytonema sp. UIC 10036 TaxID=2304196 RepID=UPI0012DA7CF0|nr:hypothetical protein [Scytonema sp. UIC 10036]MUG93692.1 hypothetical protein [Scytonema sp. UIC 10036]
MEILIESTKEFEQDLEAFSQPDRSVIVNNMNQYFQRILNDRKYLSHTNYLEQFRKINLNNYDSSLYSLRLSPAIRVIITIDEDPIFDRIIITLYRVVSAVEASEAYTAVANSIYKYLILDNQEADLQPS